jgi:hypothetical protein
VRPQIQASSQLRISIWKRHDRGAEHQSLGHSLPMLRKEMAIHLPYEHPTVLVAEPFCDRVGIDARHDGHTREVMAQIMESSTIPEQLFSVPSRTTV